MKSVLHIITGLNDGGAEAALFRLCLADTHDLHHVVSLTGAGKYGPLLEGRGIPVTSLNMPRGRVTLAGAWRLWRHIRQLRPDVVQTWMYHADLLGGSIARLAGRKNVCWGIRHSDLDPGVSSPRTALVARLCARLSHSVPRRIICCAERARAVHAELGYEASRLCVIPNGYDLTSFCPDAAAHADLRAELGFDAGASVIGFVARFDPVKDHGNLLEALARLRDSGQAPACLLVGTGMDDRNEALAAMIAARGLSGQVRLLGRRDDIPRVMNALDLHVMSSLSEAFPNVLAEAMACGTPCVATDVGDAAVILGDTGRIVPPRDPKALADAVSAMLAEVGTPAWAARKMATRRRVAEHFSIRRMVDSYREVWF